MTNKENNVTINDFVSLYPNDNHVFSWQDISKMYRRNIDKNVFKRIQNYWLLSGYILKSISDIGFVSDMTTILHQF